MKLGNLVAVLALLLASSLAACETGPKHHLQRDCRARIDDCMDGCPQDLGMQDSCFASCRNMRCDQPPPDESGGG